MAAQTAWDRRLSSARERGQGRGRLEGVLSLLAIELVLLALCWLAWFVTRG